jgi:hypothetical protein
MKRKAQKKKEVQVKQLSLGLKSPFVNVFFNLKNVFTKRIVYFESNKYIKDQTIWCLISFQIVLILLQLILILNSIGKLPTMLPLISFVSNPIYSILSKYFIILNPILSLGLFVLNLRLSRTNYYHDKKISIYLSFLFSLIILAIYINLFRIILAFNG